mmetsp:Transcript_30394/g.77289  ORF Transcript_30394/g.77289 Transcript_30394/m.77289 type:complete len:217 (-) Transcript_30394:4520-5170(-)
MGSESLVMLMFFSLPMLRTQRFAWPWGSIISGQRRPRVTMMPFSTDKSSAGRALMFQSRTSAGSTRTSAILQPGSVSSPSPTACSIHFAVNLRRNSAVKAPVYAIKPPARTMLPITNFKFFSKTVLAAVQRTLSLPKPASSFSARSSLTTQSLASSSNLAAFRLAFASCASRAATLSRTILSSACLIASFSLAAALASSAPLSFSFFGSISRATRP